MAAGSVWDFLEATELERQTANEFQKRVWDQAYRKGARPKIPLQLRQLQGLIRDLCSPLDARHSEIRILDIGCGTGDLLSRFAKKYTCFGIDISIEAVQKARANGVQACQQNIEEGIAFGDEYFDIVTMSEVLEHVVGTDYVLSEVNRILRADGFFILTIPNVNSPLSWILQLLFDYPPLYSSRYKSTHVRDFTLRTIRKALSNNGFKVVRVEGTYVYPIMNSVSRTIANRVPRFSEMIILLNTKERKPMVTPAAAFDVRQI
jgi:2-polyprenyl-3-methyl-5-hydroxy-6-metoxy-1,4-benzoquinol methylase